MSFGVVAYTLQNVAVVGMMSVRQGWSKCPSALFVWQVDTFLQVNDIKHGHLPL